MQPLTPRKFALALAALALIAVTALVPIGLHNDWFNLSSLNPFAPSLPPFKNHAASFLFDNAGTRVMNILSPSCPWSSFKSIVARCKRNGDTLLYLFLADEKDGPAWVPFSFYRNHQIGADLHDAHLKEMQRRCEYILDQKLGCIFWLRADDSPNFNRAPQPRQEQYQKDAAKHFDKFASGWCIALEADEYMSASAVDHYAAHLQRLTDKPICVHQVPGRWSFAKSEHIDAMLLQIGFNRPASALQAMVRACRADLNKPVAAAEYHKSSDSKEAKALGRAAMEAGAIGTGNGR